MTASLPNTKTGSNDLNKYFHIVLVSFRSEVSLYGAESIAQHFNTYAGAEKLKWSILQSTIRNSKVYNSITKSIHRALFTETRKAISWNPLNQEHCQRTVVKKML